MHSCHFIKLISRLNKLLYLSKICQKFVSSVTIKCKEFFFFGTKKITRTIQEFVISMFFPRVHCILLLSSAHTIRIMCLYMYVLCSQPTFEFEEKEFPESGNPFKLLVAGILWTYPLVAENKFCGRWWKWNFERIFFFLSLSIHPLFAHGAVK